jgi:dienelactone hydrolase
MVPWPFLARQTFVDPQRVAAVGFSQGGWVALFVAEANSFEPFVGPSNLRFRAVVALYPICKWAMGRLVIPTLILIGALDDWTPAADCSEKIDAWCCRRCKSALFWRHEWVGANAWGMNKGGRFRPPFLIF